MQEEIFFLKNKNKYKKMKKLIEEKYYINKLLPNKIFKKTYNNFLCQEFDLIMCDEFWENIKKLSILSDDDKVIFGVLDPSPEYFYKYFGYYSIVELSTDIENKKISNLIEYAPKNNEADSIFSNSTIIICFPLSKKWAIYADRDFEISILAFEEDYIEPLKYFLSKWVSIEEAIDTFLYSLFEVMPKFLKTLNISKEDFKKTLIKNYTNLL